MVKIMDAEQKILRALFEEGKKNYRSIWIDLEIHPNVARQRLDKLIKNGLVKEEGRKNWKRGKPLFYYLTEKGEETLFNMLLENLNETLKITERMLGNVLSKPDIIENWRKATFKKSCLDPMKITENMPIEGVISLTNEMIDKLYGPLTKSLWLMHQIVIKALSPTHAPKNENMFIRVTETDGIYMIPEALLKETK